jgi:hypothetical protein
LNLASIPAGTPARWWFDSGLVPLSSPSDEREPVERFEATLSQLPLLLRERPPLPPIPSHAGDGPRLVILTRLTLQPGASEDAVALELAGAGSVSIQAQPLSSGRLRLWLVDAGAVPGFLAARPELPGVAVVDVVREGRWLELELELGPGWALQAATSRANGARVDFIRESAPALEGESPVPE